jgi:hypothetical protein
MKKMLNEGNQIHNFISSPGSGTVINYGSGSGSTSQKVTVPTVPVPVLVPQYWQKYPINSYFFSIRLELNSISPDL